MVMIPVHVSEIDIIQTLQPGSDRRDFRIIPPGAPVTGTAQPGIGHQTDALRLHQHARMAQNREFHRVFASMLLFRYVSTSGLKWSAIHDSNARAKRVNSSTL